MASKLPTAFPRTESPRTPDVRGAVFGSAQPRLRRTSTPRTPPPVKEIPRSIATFSRMAQPPQTPPKSARQRPESPDVETILASTRRPRRKSSATFSPALSRTRPRAATAGAPTSWRGLEGDESPDRSSLLEESGEEDGSESDSSIDVSTPLP